LLLRAHIVRVILGAGKFDWEATYLTAQTLGYFAVSLVAQSLVPMLARSYYADQDTKTPVKIAIVTLMMNIGLSLLLSHRFGILGLAAAYSFSNVLNMILLLAVLRIRHGDLDDRVIIRSTVKILMASAVMGVIIWLSLRAVLPGVNTHTRIGIFLQGAISGIAGLTVYGIIALVFRFDEVKIIAGQLRKYWMQIRGLANGGLNGRR
jgi:putative peptidoglycan lipid II flippase